ncbi:MAG: DUF881 domain-containing protein [Clostridia bacterium]|jgi:uncharacterized protein YlxW (UPF0749 family)|nr:DUF881 domain-containing protein [Clostridia bacterium]
MKNNKGITLIKLLIIIMIVIFVIFFIRLKFSVQIDQTINIIYKTLTKQIDIDKEIKENEILMGITDVKGEGIEIHILDGKDIIHQEDLIILIDELKNAGSQAISINEQRITNSTYLYCDGSVILIDGEKIGNPFTIKAIGNSEVIYGALNRNKGYISTLKKDGIEINIEKKQNIEIAKTNNKELLNYNKNKTKIITLMDSNQIVGKSDIQEKGIEIFIDESKAKLTAVSFLQIINDLNSAGAKAISINGQRITNMTDIMDISSKYVLINSVPISEPYKIKAIGNQEKIKEVLNYNNSQINKILSKGNEIKIYNSFNLKVDKYIQKKDKNKMIIDYLR